jgi:hypothetical protein
VYEKLDWEFYHNKTGHSGLMGNIRICDLVDNPGSLDDLCWHGALEYSARHKTPIYIDCSKVNLDTYPEIIEQKFRKLLASAGKENPSIVLWDIFPLAFPRDNVLNDGEDFKMYSSIGYVQEFIKLSKDFYIGLTLSFCRNEFGIGVKELALYIKFMLDKEPNLVNRIVLSCGYKFKTELRMYGGGGFQAIVDLKFMLKELGVGKEALNKLFFWNSVGLLNWWTEKKVVVEEAQKWPCWTCEKWFPMSQPKLSKFDLDFCSPPCFSKASKIGFKK